MQYIWPIFVLLLVGASFFYRNAMMKAANKTYANYTLADMARRLGLNVVEGDPGLNMVMAQSAHGVQRYESKGGVLGALAGDGTKQTRARAVGNPWGRPYEFLYWQRSDVDKGLTETLHTLYFECSLAARVNAAFPPFEVHLRTPAQFLEPNAKLALPPSPTGNAALDQVMVVKCADPRVAPALAPALVPLMSQGFVHILGGEGEVRALSTHASHSVLVMNAELFLRALEQIACTLEGRPATHVAAA
jgi:hypothetical protein